MARDGLAAPLREALEAAKAQSITSRRHGATITRKGQTRSINLDVVPLGDVAGTVDRHFLVVFEELGLTPAAPTGIQQASPRPDDEAPQLHAELTATRDYLQAITGEHQDTVEELGAANEELVAANEELQSANEELETSREEMQSLNEELQTVNAELQGKLDELSRANNDMKNLLNGTDIGTVFLDIDLRIKRYTEQAKRVIRLIPTDVGRSIGDLASTLRYDRLIDDAQEVLRTLVVRETEVYAHDGAVYLMRILPYRTTDNVIDGLVLTFIDLTGYKAMQVRDQRGEP
jgi:two-component system CheB/CheR fusion protein